MKVEARIRQLEGGAKVTAASGKSSTGDDNVSFSLSRVLILLSYSLSCVITQIVRDNTPS